MWNPANMTKSFISTYGVEDGSVHASPDSYTRILTSQVAAAPSAYVEVPLLCHRLQILFTITNYAGYDPEVNIGQAQRLTSTYNMYPRSRTYTFGVQLAF